MNILAIGAHPDDIEYGCGGTLLKMSSQEQVRLFYFIATKGELSGGASVREKEQEEAARLLKVEKIYWGGFKDANFSVGRDLIGKLEEVISEIRPEVIFVNYPQDTHQDHRYLADCTVVASRYCKKVVYYEDYTSVNYEPDIFVDISDVLGEKVKLLECHKSQIERVYPTGLDIVESTRAVASFRGFQAKVKYAEGFKALRYLLDTI